ncbi:MAG: acyl-CoA dehydrogenase [Woeseiaceae bacterium]|jgi:butyryl-CoA dehydrogenase
MIVNRRDLDFLFYEVLDLDVLLRAPRFEAYDCEAISAILDTAQAIAEDKYLACAGELDVNEPVLDNGKVSTLPVVKEALDAFAEAGFFGATFDEVVGGWQLPYLVNMAVSGMFSCANTGIFDYSFLTVATASLLNTFGSEEQKKHYLPPMLEGRWFGTMCLSEPQAGSSLSDIRTMAEPSDAKHYRITGTKMWISGGDQEISENIVHAVLAKIVGGPPGVKGISLFIVPKYRVNSDGSLGERNNVALAGLNHKMGHRGITNTLLNFGEAGECRGYLVGEPHQGLKYMFHMMNEARIGVGHGAVMSGLAGYLYSLDYARSRPQGRHPHNKDPNTPQLMIIEHADVKRMLLAQKAYVEGGLALISYCAYLVDLQKVSADDEERQRINRLLDILTPVAKSWPSEYCLEANKLAIQVLGGYGYSREYPVERFYRDNRLNHIHEGTHGIHGIDLLGRKVRMQNGAAYTELMTEIEATIETGLGDDAHGDGARALKKVLTQLTQTTQTVLACDDLDLGLANATLYLDAFGHTIVAWMWLKQGLAATKGLADASARDRAFYEGKQTACRYFFGYELPKVYASLKRVASLDDICHRVTPEQFIG